MDVLAPALFETVMRTEPWLRPFAPESPTCRLRDHAAVDGTPGPRRHRRAAMLIIHGGRLPVRRRRDLRQPDGLRTHDLRSSRFRDWPQPAGAPLSVH